MSCAVTISSVSVVRGSGDRIDAVRVTGTATDCRSVKVFVYCAGRLANIITELVALDGTWDATVNVKAKGCGCGIQMRVRVECADDPHCFDENDLGDPCGGEPTPGTCPTITSPIPPVEVGDCDANGRRPVTVRATVSDPSRVQSYRWEFGDGSPAVTVAGGAQPQPQSHNYSPREQAYVITLNILGTGTDATGFPCLDSETVSVVVPPCACPALDSITVTPRSCAADGSSRTIEFEAARSGAAPDLLEWDFGDGTPVESHTGSDAADGRASHSYAAGEYTVKVTARKAGCPAKDSQEPFKVEACPAAHENPPGNNGGQTPTNEGQQQPPSGTVSQPQIPWCLLLGIAAVFMVALGALIFAFFFCSLCWADSILAALVGLGVVSAGSTTAASVAIVVVLIVLIFVGEAIFIAGNILFLIWLLTCGSCRTNCSYLWNIFGLLVVVGGMWGIFTTIAGIASAISGRPCFIFWGVGLIDIGFLTSLLLYYGAAVGCWNWQDWVPGFLRLRIPDPMRFICGDN